MNNRAKALMEDPRVIEAKKLLLEAVKDHQKKIVGIHPPDPALKQEYDHLVAQYSEQRGFNLWFPYIGSGFGKGALVELEDGSIKYDFITGVGPNYWGHNHPDILSSGIDAAISDPVMQGNLQQNYDALRFTETLIKASKMDHCFLTTSGAMAVENALKIIFQKKYPANRLLAFERCFMGRTMVAAQITDRPGYREHQPNTMPVDYVPFYDPDHPEASISRAVHVLKQHIHRYPKQHAAMCFELIQGDGGFYVGSHSFFEAICNVLKENQIAVFIDEVQTFGRTPELFGYHYFGLQQFADVVTIGKLSQVCATLFTKNFAPRPGLLSQTFIAGTAALRAGQTIIDSLLSGDYFGENGKIIKIYSHFTNRLKAMAEKYPNAVSGPFGFGGMIAFTPFDGSYEKASKLLHQLFHAGLILFITGAHPTRIRMLVPMGVITTDEIDLACDIIEKTIVGVN